MGELKKLSEEQVVLAERAKKAGRQVYLASLGLVSKVEEEGKKLASTVEVEGKARYAKLVAVGEQVRGEKAAETPKPVLALVGLASQVEEEGKKLVAQVEEEGKKLVAKVEEEGKKLVSKVEEESKKLFGDLVAAGEKRGVAPAAAAPAVEVEATTAAA